MKLTLLMVTVACFITLSVNAQTDQQPTYQIDEDYDKFEGSHNFRLSHIQVSSNVASLGVGAAASFLQSGNNRFVIGVGYVASSYGNQQRRLQETRSKHLVTLLIDGKREVLGNLRVTNFFDVEHGWQLEGGVYVSFQLLRRIAVARQVEGRIGEDVDVQFTFTDEALNGFREFVKRIEPLAGVVSPSPGKRKSRRGPSPGRKAQRYAAIETYLIGTNCNG